MIRNILIATFFVTLWFGISATAEAEQIIEVMDNNVQKVTISITESTLHITGANSEILKVDGADKHYELNLPKGCYILKVGKVVRKISIR